MDTDDQQIQLRAILDRAIEEVPGARYVASEASDGTVGEFVWVPYGPGFEIPVFGEYSGTGPFEWALTFAVVDGRPRCLEVRCLSRPGGPPITPEALHRFPLGQKLEEAVLMASRPVDEVPRRAARWKNIEEVRAQRADVAAHHRRSGNGRRKKITDEFLAEVAQVYRQNVATGKPAQAVAEYCHYTSTSARRVIAQARQRGFLGPALPGRAGEQLKEEEDG
jgi:hypothetical protein